MKYLVAVLLCISNVAMANELDNQLTGVFKEMNSWFTQPVKKTPPKVVEPKVAQTKVVETKEASPTNKVAHVEVSDAVVKRIRDETCAKPNGVCFTEVIR
jgi:hypothetical protein